MDGSFGFVTERVEHFSFVYTLDQRLRPGTGFERVARQPEYPFCSYFIFEHCFVWYSLYSEVDFELIFLHRDRFLDA